MDTKRLFDLGLSHVLYKVDVAYAMGASLIDVCERLCCIAGYYFISTTTRVSKVFFSFFFSLLVPPFHGR